MDITTKGLDAGSAPFVRQPQTDRVLEHYFS